MMKKQRNHYSSGFSTGNSIEPIKPYGAKKPGYSLQTPQDISKTEKVDKEEQSKFINAMGGAFKKLKQAKEEEAKKKAIQEKNLKKMPKMIIPDLGPDFRHEVKLNQSEEGQEIAIRRIAQKSKGRDFKVKAVEGLGKGIDIEG